jgi:F-type H+-transporting ATPase subunit b
MNPILAPASITIVPNLVLAAFLVIPFLVTMVALHFALFKPMYQYLEDRTKTVDDANDEAERLASAVSERLTSLDAQLASARKEVTAIRAAARERALGAEAEILDAARRNADAVVSAAVERIQKERVEAAATLRATASSLSNEMASQVLGRQVAN